ncbi:sialidase [Streptomyces sp. NPDC046385]|uniref:RCC1 domain-containing protein n=1 Tax=Streptomyces sp. NPDC046385 TaxID=3154918 RepID=UPI0033C4BFA1
MSGGVGSSSTFAFALGADGTVKAWGGNTEGQLGNGSITQQTMPAPVSQLTGIKDIAAGGMHALALDAHGQVYAWGSNAYGQLGSTSTGDDRTAPVRVQGLGKVKEVAAGGEFSLALLEDGTVYAWGQGIHGQLGNGGLGSGHTPQRVVRLENIAAIAAGRYHALALTSDATVKSWGYNLYGQLGDSSTKLSAVPVDVDTLEDVSRLVVGAHHNYAVFSDGVVVGWGSNRYGQLLQDDDGALTSITGAVEIPRLKDVQALAAGARHGVAITGGDVYAWGDNSEGQLGNGTTTAGYHKVELPGTGYTGVAASLDGNTTYLY